MELSNLGHLIPAATYKLVITQIQVPIQVHKEMNVHHVMVERYANTVVELVKYSVKTRTQDIRNGAIVLCAMVRVPVNCVTGKVISVEGFL